MRFELVLHIDSDEGLRLFSRVVERGYSRVPVSGEIVFLDDAEEHALAIDAITWSNEGAPMLEFMLSAEGQDHLDDWALDNGFTEVSPHA